MIDESMLHLDPWPWRDTVESFAWTIIALGIIWMFSIAFAELVLRGKLEAALNKKRGKGAKRV